MQLVSDAATIQFVSNATTAGTNVSYPSGGSSFYPSGTCPQPVHGSLYSLASAIQLDPRFTLAENGSRYVVDPVASLSQPLTAPNGSAYEAVIFLNLNTSDTIYPCNLAGAYKNPLGQIEVVMPLLADGFVNASSRAYYSFSGNELQFNCPQETGLTTFPIAKIPNQFQVGGFSIDLIFNGTNYSAPNGTSYSGFNYVFNVSYDNVSQLELFNWPSQSAMLQNHLPNPIVVAPFEDGIVMRFYAANSTLYLTITTLG